MSAIEVSTTTLAEGWECLVTIRNGAETRHRVRVRHSDLERLAPGASDPEDLVRASFAFLLDREPKESILREFDLMVISRYFPEYEREMRERLQA